MAALLVISINWRCKDLQHLLIFTDNFNISELNDGKTFLAEAKMVPLKTKIKMPSTPSPNEYLSFEPIFDPLLDNAFKLLI
jgi:hypothetical protein